MSANGSYESDIHNLIDTHGINFFGAAALTPYQAEIAAEWGELMASFPFGLSIGITLLHPVVDQLPKRLEENSVRLNYRHHAYAIVNERLDLAASQISSILQSAGFHAFPVAASQHTNMEKLSGMISHKMVARLSGLGWIGKSCLLVTPQAGPRVRWATILTDAPLPTRAEILEERCGNCRQCVDICPAGAFTGENFRHGEARAVRYDAHLCNRYLDELEEKQGFPAVCGMCLYICPYGRKRHH